MNGRGCFKTVTGDKIEGEFRDDKKVD